MSQRKLSQQRRAAPSQLYDHLAAILFAAGANYGSQGFEPIHQFHGAVMFEA
jgi:hypothetical protein